MFQVPNLLVGSKFNLHPFRVVLSDLNYSSWVTKSQCTKFLGNLLGVTVMLSRKRKNQIKHQRRRKRRTDKLKLAREHGDERIAGKGPLCALVRNYSRACTGTVMISSTEPVGATTRQAQPPSPVIRFEPATQIAPEIRRWYIRNESLPEVSPWVRSS